MPTTISKYRVYCTTDNKYTYTWSDVLPTTCPENHEHTIDQNMTVITETVSDNAVYITSKSYEGTQGYYMMEGSTTQTEEGMEMHVVDHAYKYPVCIFGLTLHNTPENFNDCIDVILNPDTVIGYLIAPATSGSTTIVVNPTVLQYANLGFHLTISDGVNRHDCDTVVEKNLDNNTVSVNLPLAYDFAPGSLVLLNLYIVKKYHICVTGRCEIGYGCMSGKTIPANTVVRVVYHNRNKQAKQVAYVYEYTY